MGSVTPIYAWPYPFDADTLSAATYQTEMTAIDTTLAAVGVEQTNLLKRQFFGGGKSSNVSVPIATTTALPLDCDAAGVWNPSGIVVDPMASTPTITVGAGLWSMNAQMQAVASGSLPTNLRFTLSQNGTAVARQNMHPPPLDALDAQFQLACAVMVFFAAPGTVQLTFIYNGGPATMNAVGALQIRKVRAP